MEILCCISLMKVTKESSMSGLPLGGLDRGITAEYRVEANTASKPCMST